MWSIKNYNKDIATREEVLSSVKLDLEKIEHQNLSKEELLFNVIRSAYTQSIKHEHFAEISEICSLITEAILQLNLEIDVDDSYINSLFNFNSVYIPLYDLLDAATNHSINGSKKTQDYRNGVIDAIVALRRFQRYHGFGDEEWRPDYNTALEVEVPDRLNPENSKNFNLDHQFHHHFHDGEEHVH